MVIRSSAHRLHLFFASFFLAAAFFFMTRLALFFEKDVGLKKDTIGRVFPTRGLAPFFFVAFAVALR
jgi:hypothetical protein